MNAREKFRAALLEIAEWQRTHPEEMAAWNTDGVPQRLPVTDSWPDGSVTHDLDMVRAPFDQVPRHGPEWGAGAEEGSEGVALELLFELACRV